MLWNNEEKDGILNEGYQGGRRNVAQDGYPFGENERGHQGNSSNGSKTPPPPPKRQPQDGDD